MVADHRAVAAAPREVLRRTPGGPFVVTRTDGVVRVDDSQGRTAIADAVALDGLSEIADRLRNGVDVTIDGRSVGTLTQIEHGFWRRDRAVTFTPHDASGFPPEPYFRLRRYRTVVCENAAGPLISSRPLVTGDLAISPGVPYELVLVHVCVAFGMFVALSS